MKHNHRATRNQFLDKGIPFLFPLSALRFFRVFYIRNQAGWELSLEKYPSTE